MFHDNEYPQLGNSGSGPKAALLGHSLGTAASALSAILWPEFPPGKPSPQTQERPDT